MSKKIWVLVNDNGTVITAFSELYHGEEYMDTHDYRFRDGYTLRETILDSKVDVISSERA